MASEIETSVTEPPCLNRPIGPGWGFFICIMAEVFYVGANFLLRYMTDYPEVSFDWTLLVKESVTVTTCLAIIIFLFIRGNYRLPSWKNLGLMVLAGVLCQLIGARFHLWAYALIGIVLTMPLIVTSQLLGITVLGSVMLGEKVTRLKVVNMIVLILAIATIALSQLPLEQAEQHELATSTGTKTSLLLGFFASMIAAGGYCLYVLIVRGIMRTDIPLLQEESSPAIASTHEFLVTSCKLQEEPSPAITSTTKMNESVPMPITMTMLLVCGVGMLVGTVFLWAEKGITAFWDVPTECWYIAISCGILNCCGFYFRSLAFQAVTASKMVFISAFQILFLSLLGITFFGEAANTLLGVGLVLTTLGIAIAGFME